MRLLDTQSYELHEFFDEEVPAYAILSHRWNDKETSFQDYRKKRDLDSAGRCKITNACNFARSVRGQQWLWIDTCCIDKKSSAELSEAINSMFNWYREAVECYAYLEDVRPTGNGSLVEQRHDFSCSAWFTRGWTLQELIAPDRVLFCNSSWQIVGHKTSDDVPAHGSSELSPNLIHEIHKITAIPERVLRWPDAYTEYSMAQRLSWASGRISRRVEDESYCLLGLLQVHMPLLYGERQGAFIRLQQEILKNTTDESILAWRDPNPPFYELGTSLLADAPSCFRDSHSIRMSEDLRIPRITIQSGLVRIDSSAIDECYVLEEESDSTVHLVRLRCVSYDAHEQRAVERPQSTADAEPCILMLTSKPCGHYVRLGSPNEGPIFDEPMLDEPGLGGSGKWKKIREMTFHIHINAPYCYAKPLLRRPG